MYKYVHVLMEISSDEIFFSWWQDKKQIMLIGEEKKMKT